MQLQAVVLFCPLQFANGGEIIPFHLWSVLGNFLTWKLAKQNMLANGSKGMGQPLVLVVDDNKITTKLLARYLTAAGYRVAEAYDGMECLEKIEEEIPDAVILDVMMPRLDGYETVQRIRSDVKTRDIPVVIVTALNDVANQVKAIESGADDFLSKPIEDKLLIAKVKILTSLSMQRKRIAALEEMLESCLNGDATPEEIRSRLELLRMEQQA